MESLNRPNILALSYLFPNRAQPDYGIFVFNRLIAVGKFCNVKVIAPVQWYPLIHLFRGTLWGKVVPLRDVSEGIEVHHPRFPVIPRYVKWLDAFTYLWAVRSVLKFLEKRESYSFDLIDVHWTYPDIVAGYVISRRKGKKILVTVRGREALYLEENTLRRMILTFFLRKVDRVVTLSEELREMVINLGIAPDRVHVILNGVDTSRFYLLDRYECRNRLGLSLEKKIIISVGRLTEGKGHHELIKVIANISKTENVDLYIIGGVNPEDDFSNFVISTIAKVGLTNVHLIDKVDHGQLPVWYNAADLFCLASKGEGCPNVVLEALACGTPVVVTNVGAVNEFVVPGENGFLVEKGENSSLERDIRKALNFTWNREMISSGMKKWGWSSCADQIVEIYQSVLRDSRNLRG